MSSPTDLRALGAKLVASVSLALACSRPAPLPLDTGRDARRDDAPRIDTDRDGLCDETERGARSNPAEVDTDGDGLLDGFEYLLGSDPLTSLDPPAAQRLVLYETPGSTVFSEQVLDYRSVGGEVVSASVLDRVRGLDGRALSELAPALTVALDADPANFIQAVVESRFVGVTGRVRLHWRVTLQRSAEATVNLGCRRAYSGVFVAKREGDQIVASRPLVVEVTPSETEMDAGAGAWPAVSPDGQCLSRGPCI